MRIIAGILKGRRLNIPKGEEIRPTTDRVREAIFSALLSVLDMENVAVLDLFAGSGSLGFESLSRGAKQAVFVEMNKTLAEEIRTSADSFHLNSQTQVIAADAIKTLSKPPSGLLAQAPFDLIFADPPYDMQGTQSLGRLLEKSKLLRDGSVFVLESSRRTDLTALTEQTPKLELLKEKEYGETRVGYYLYRQRAIEE